MIKRPKQFITQPYTKNHSALDLRCVDKERSWLKVQKAIAPEHCVILRTSKSHGLDNYGNPYVVMKGLETGFIFKSIHVKPKRDVKPEKIIPAGGVIGKPVIAGNSKSLHEHFVVQKEDDTEGKTHINPIHYFDLRGIGYE